MAPFDGNFRTAGVFVPASAGVSTKTSVPYGRLEGMMSKNENRLNFRMTDETATKIERWYQKDNCRSKNEFIEKAVNCYADMLAAGESTTLPRAVQSAIDARLKTFEDRIASLLYKQAVEMDMVTSLVLQSLNVSGRNGPRASPPSSALTVSCGWNRSSVSWRANHGKADRQKPVHQVRLLSKG